MKQDISIQQLQELTPNQLKALLKWWDDRNKKDNLPFAPTPLVSCYIDGRLHFAPLLTLGLCIELLRDSGQYGLSEIGDLFYGMSTGEIDQDELIDALWQAVKEVLK